MSKSIQFVNTFIGIVKKILVVFLVLTLCLSVGFFGYNNYKEKEALSFALADENECESLEGFDYSYQICDSPSSAFVRKVDIENRNQIVVFIYENANQEKRYGVEIMWNEECVPSTVIVTDLEFSDGTSKTLKCEETGWGTVLRHGYTLSMPIRDVNFDYGGFRVNERFSADLETLERQYTLGKSRPVAEIEEERLLAEGRRLEEERIAAEQQQENARIAAQKLQEEERLAETARVENERRIEAARKIAIEKAEERLACNAVQDKREADYLRRYDNVKNDVALTTYCDFGNNRNEYSQCTPTFSIKNNSRFTIEFLDIGYGNTFGSCPDVISQEKTSVFESLSAGTSMSRKAIMMLWYGEGTRVCAQINSVDLKEPRKYPRESCD